MTEENKAQIKMFMRYKIGYLRFMAKSNGLDAKGTKKDLAKRLSKFEDERSKRYWDSISGRR